MQNTIALKRTMVEEKKWWSKVKALDVTWLVMRLALGYLFLHAGIEKLTTAGGWTAKGFLAHGTGPFASTFAHLAGNGAVDNLVMWGEVLIGVALVLGVAVRFTAFWGAVMMLLFYLPSLPPQNGWISEQIVILLVFIGLMFSATGYFFGLDWLAKKKLEPKWRPLKYLMG